MSCWPELRWPYCNPDPSASPPIYECGGGPGGPGGVLEGQDCCLSVPTTDKGVSNCPPGWASNPTVDQEWCTDSQGIIHNSEYRHKCHRVLSCPNAAQDPATSCKTCKEPKYAFPECSSTKCANPKLLAPGCSVCATYDKLAPPDCDKCLDVSESLCGQGIPGKQGVKGGQTCVDTRYDEFNCGGCVSGWAEGKGVKCSAGEICNDGACTCGVKFGIVYALQGQAKADEAQPDDWVPESTFEIILGWTSPGKLSENQVNVVVTPADGDQVDIAISEANTKVEAGVFKTVLKLAKPKSSPIAYTIKLRGASGSVVEEVEKTLQVDFPDYASDNLNCGQPENLCHWYEKCVRGRCKIPKEPLECGGELTTCLTEDGDEVCADTRSNRLHCGGCLQPCDVGTVCADSKCEASACALKACPQGGIDCVGGGITNATYSRDSTTSNSRITVAYSLRVPSGIKDDASIYLFCKNTETDEEMNIFGDFRVLEGECIVKTLQLYTDFVPNVCALIIDVYGHPFNTTYMSRKCVDSVSSTCSQPADEDTALKLLNDPSEMYGLLNACIDLTRSVDNCKTCNTRCLVTQDCVGGECKDVVDYCRKDNNPAPTRWDGQCVYAKVIQSSMLSINESSFTVQLTYDLNAPIGATYQFNALGNGINSNGVDGEIDAFDESPKSNAQRTLTFTGKYVGDPLFVRIIVTKGGKRYDSQTTRVEVL